MTTQGHYGKVDRQLRKRQRRFLAVGLLFTFPPLVCLILWGRQDRDGDILSLIEFIGLLILSAGSLVIGLFCIGLSVGLILARRAFAAQEHTTT